MNQTSASAAAVKPLNILIVDDSATMRALLHRVVGLADLPIGAIYQAPNGLEALKILETHSVQAVFTDLNMPVMNGMQLLREMAKRDRWKDLLRIIISTDGSRLRREEARELNVNLYVEKPFRPEVVRDVLCQIASADVLLTCTTRCRARSSRSARTPTSCSSSRSTPPQFADAVGAGEGRVAEGLGGLRTASLSKAPVEIALPEPLGTVAGDVAARACSRRTARRAPAAVDGVGEFANMVCGAWLSKAERDCRRSARVPEVTRMTRGLESRRRHRGRRGAGLPDGGRQRDAAAVLIRSS